MRIAHVTATFPPYWGGTGNVCFHNTRELARRGHEVHVYTALVEGAQSEEVIEGVYVHRLKPLFRFGNAPFLSGLLGLKDFDLIHLHHPFIFGAEMIWLVSKLRGIPLIITHHNDLIGVGLRGWLFDWYTRVATNTIFKTAKCLIPVSMDYANNGRLSKHFARHANVIEVPNGVDPYVFHPLKAEGVREHWGIRKEASLGIFVAALDRAHFFKGLDLLLKSLTNPVLAGVHLMVVGEGDLRGEYVNLSRELEIHDRVVFTGGIGHEELPNILSAGDFLVLPTSPPESFGLVLVEALACGRPVITSDIPGVRTVVDDTIDGYLFNPGDVEDLVEKIGRMVGLSAQEREIMGASGREKVLQKYTWERAGEGLEEIYSEVASK